MHLKGLVRWKLNLNRLTYLPVITLDVIFSLGVLGLRSATYFWAIEEF